MRVQPVVGLIFWLILASNAVDQATAASGCASIPDTKDWKGINVTLQTSYRPDDFAKIASWGSRVIRLVIQADPAQPQGRKLIDSSTLSFTVQGMDILDQAVGLAKAAGLKVVLDMHTYPGHEGAKIWLNDQYWTVFKNNWKSIAKHFKNETSVLGYDLMNEPNVVDSLDEPERTMTVVRMRTGSWAMPENWKGTSKDYLMHMDEIAKDINSIDSSKAIIVEGWGLFGAGENFEWMETLSACNVVYSFHMYSPHNFTHSGRGNIDPDIWYDHDQQFVLMEKSSRAPKAFSQKYSVPIWIGEFGVTYFSENRGGDRWMDDAMQLFEKNGWGWAYWTYSIPLRSLEADESGQAVMSAVTKRMAVYRKHLAQP